MDDKTDSALYDYSAAYQIASAECELVDGKTRSQGIDVTNFTLYVVFDGGGFS